MSQASRVSCFQNVFDLLNYEPPVSPAALALIEETERRIGGTLPAALRDWYSREGVVEIGAPLEQWGVAETEGWYPLSGPVPHRPVTWTQQLWYNYVGGYDCRYATPDSLTAVLAQIDGRLDAGPARARFARVMVESYDQLGMMVEWSGSASPDDPPVWRTDRLDTAGWALCSQHFSALVFESIACGYAADQTPLACHEPDPNVWPDLEDEPPLAPPPAKLFVNGLWLRAPDEPLDPPVLDYLTDHLGNPERLERAGGVVTHQFGTEGGLVRVTADARMVPGGRSAWWVHARSEDRLEEIFRLLRPFGTLAATLTSDMRPGRTVLQRARGAGG